MSRKIGSGSCKSFYQVKSEVIKFRVTPEVKEILQWASEKTELTISDVLHEAIEQYIRRGSYKFEYTDNEKANRIHSGNGIFGQTKSQIRIRRKFLRDKKNNLLYQISQ